MNHHASTQRITLRALNKSKAMEPVRDLSWGLGFQPEAVKAHTGFEPVPPP
jgi:hypothetical protein